jgi:hypothetical protein
LAAGLLGGPYSVQVGGHPGDMHSPGGHLVTTGVE